MQEENKAYAHWLYQAVGMGGRAFLRELTQIAAPKEVYELMQRDKLKTEIAGKYHKKIKQIEEFSRDYDVHAAYREMCEKGISFVTCGDAAYPKRLSRIADAPYGLYYAGRLPGEDRKSVAVVGARNCSEYGRYMARQFGAELAEAGVQVVSGMARGIDGISQNAALEAGGYSLGVLGCGVDICYPKENQTLYDKLLERGGVCSEYPPGTAPRALLFPPRNRIISGFADTVLVVEAREKSGTLITVDMALEQGREVYALPGRATDPLSQGCNRLIRQGAGMAVSPQEFLRDLLETSEIGNNYTQQSLFFLEGMQDKLYRILDFEPRSAEMLQSIYAREYEGTVTIPELFHEMLILCANGYAKQIGGRYFARAGEY